LHLRRLALLATASCGGTCEAERSDAGPADCADAGFVGDPGSPPDLEIIAIRPDGSFETVRDGGELDLFTPVQGGKVILAGALLTNVELSDCGRLRIGASLRDPTDPDERTAFNAEATVRYEPLSTRPGWAVPILVNDRRNMAPNLESCGFHPYARDTDGCAWILEVRLLDTRTEEIRIEERVNVTPICPEDDPGVPEGVPPELELELCTCQCAADYEKGRCDTDTLSEWIDPPLDCE
jgi:hypothetical protein